MLRKAREALAALRRKLARRGGGRGAGGLTMDEVKNDAVAKSDPVPPQTHWSGGG
jgi:hypothetical protein